MERKKLVRIESISMIVITLGIFFLIFNLYFIIKGISRDILYINNKNRESVKRLFEKSEQYKEVKDFDQIKKIQYFLAFNNMEFTIYYKDGSTDKIYDGGLIDLKEYIEKKGYNKGKAHIILGMVVICACLGLNAVREDVAEKIDFIDKKQMENRDEYIKTTKS